MKSALYASLFVVTLLACTGACTNILGGFDYNGKGGGVTTGGTTGTGMTTCMPCASVANCPAPVGDCAVASCDNGCCGETPLALDTKCTTQGGHYCDGKGMCVGCVVALECPAVSTTCQSQTCTSGVCGTKNAAMGAGCNDSGGQFCDGNGKCVACLAATDCPSTGTVCSTAVCNNGTCSTTSAPATQTCSESSGTVCDGNGKCVACNTDANCPATGTVCAVPKCDTTAHTCSNTDATKGMACEGTNQVCDGMGKCVSAACNDGLLDGTETDVDCGGSCSPCVNTRTCKGPGDCASGFCSALKCAACTIDTNCAANNYCDLTNNGGTCTPTKTPGKACTAADQCASGFCANGVCCNAACNGTCQGCTMALTGTADGTCSTYLSGTAAPAGQCTPSGTLPCANDGRCHAGGTCEQAMSGTACGTTCANGMLTTHQCDGSGTCTAASSMACNGNLECAANGTSCLASCGTDPDCAPSYWCNAGTCTAKGTPGSGATCTGGNQCTTGFCVDGYCCDTACNTACQACGGGTCKPVTGGQNDPRGLCAVTAKTSCGTDGTCNAGACRDWLSGTDCTNSCSGGSQTTAACNGTGTCVPGAMKACSPYVCGAGACKTSCTTHGDCIAGDFCWLGACTKANALAIGDASSTTCALVAGNVQCWGYGNEGELGNGTTTNTSSTPVPVSTISGVTAIAGGDFHNCALVGGGIQCWGYNNHGQLGSSPATMCGSSPCSLVPAVVPGLTSGVTAIGAGGFHSCAVRGGGLQCWGWNNQGQLGNNTQTDSPVPVSVSGLGSGVAAVAGGEHHTCALTTAGGVQCWGWNSYGQAGANPPFAVLVPQPISGLSSGVTAIAAGDTHTCALLSTGAVKCWGRNSNGQLGNGTTTDTNASAPVQVTGLTSGVVAIAAGFAHTCAVLSSGAVQCWGWDRYGELGNSGAGCIPVTNPPQCTTPVPVTGLSGATAIAAGFEYTCALTATGPQCWGSNTFGQLGNGTTTDSVAPVLVSEP